ncbi:low choriolytic enzyme-like [Antennarius striatus]|uniref:low choriolytic enzyme-like n=1 Tax=Antennarius striatus TaxID=241820 RepID=UPI0035B113B5
MGPALILLSLLAGSTGSDAQNLSSDISDIISTVNVNLSPILSLYDDIRKYRPENNVGCVNRGCLWPKSGDVVRVPFFISTAFNQDEYQVIRSALLSFQRNTCIHFQPQTTELSYLYFFSGSGCWSYLGNINQPQPISLNKGGCVTVGIVQHEILHALGFHHEQNRLDRDTYVHILTNNTLPENERLFKKVATNNLGTPYDYNSIMHYSKYKFSKNRRPTILAKREPFVFGKAKTMSVTDIIRVNRLYKCCEKYKC